MSSVLHTPGSHYHLTVVCAPNEIQCVIELQASPTPLLPTLGLNFTSRHALHKLKVAVGILSKPSICGRHVPGKTGGLS